MATPVVIPSTTPVVLPITAPVIPITAPIVIPITTPVFAPDLKAAIMASLASVPVAKQGRVGFGISLTGAEVSVGWKPSSVFEVGGYAKRLWGGGWVAGAQGQVIW